MLVSSVEGLFSAMVTSRLMPRSPLMEQSSECAKSFLFDMCLQSELVWAKCLCISFAQTLEGVSDGLWKASNLHLASTEAQHCTSQLSTFVLDARTIHFIKGSFRCNSMKTVSSAMGTIMLILDREGCFSVVITSCPMRSSCLMEWSPECAKSFLFVTRLQNGFVWAKRLCISFTQIHKGAFDRL